MSAKDHVCEVTKEMAEKVEKYNKCKQLLQVGELLFQWTTDLSNVKCQPLAPVVDR